MEKIYDDFQLKVFASFYQDEKTRNPYVSVVDLYDHYASWPLSSESKRMEEENAGPKVWTVLDMLRFAELFYAEWIKPPEKVWPKTDDVLNKWKDDSESV